MKHPLLFGCLTLALAAVAGAQDKPPHKVDLKELPPVKSDNKNTLLTRYKDRIKATASTTWSGWPPENAMDGVPTTSWFSAKGDAAAHKTKPWLQIDFPEEITVTRVTILGNRDSAWLNGYTILAGALELFDKDGKRLHYEDNEGVGNFRDFDFKLEKPITKVRSVRFWSLGDQGDQNPYDDIAIAEIQID